MGTWKSIKAMELCGREFHPIVNRKRKNRAGAKDNVPQRPASPNLALPPNISRSYQIRVISQKEMFDKRPYIQSLTPDNLPGLSFSYT